MVWDAVRSKGHTHCGAHPLECLLLEGDTKFSCGGKFGSNPTPPTANQTPGSEEVGGLDREEAQVLQEVGSPILNFVQLHRF